MHNLADVKLGELLETPESLLYAMRNNQKDWAISSQASIMEEGSTTIPRGSRAKWPEAPNSMPGARSVAVRFAEKVDKQSSSIFWHGTRCHEWTGCIMPNGYGQMHISGKTAYAHRIAWELVNGSTELFVLHHCDNRKCVNDAHLFDGTFDQNMADMVSKKRQAHGERSGHAKLTVEQVRAIREMNGTNAEIAKVFGISGANVSVIKNRLSWRCIDDDIACSGGKLPAANAGTV